MSDLFNTPKPGSAMEALSRIAGEQKIVTPGWRPKFKRDDQVYVHGGNDTRQDGFVERAPTYQGDSYQVRSNSWSKHAILCQEEDMELIPKTPPVTWEPRTITLGEYCDAEAELLVNMSETHQWDRATLVRKLSERFIKLLRDAHTPLSQQFTLPVTLPSQRIEPSLPDGVESELLGVRLLPDPVDPHMRDST